MLRSNLWGLSTTSSRIARSFRFLLSGRFGTVYILRSSRYETISRRLAMAFLATVRTPKAFASVGWLSARNDSLGSLLQNIAERYKHIGFTPAATGTTRWIPGTYSNARKLLSHHFQTRVPMSIYNLTSSRSVSICGWNTKRGSLQYRVVPSEARFLTRRPSFVFGLSSSASWPEMVTSTLPAASIQPVSVYADPFCLRSGLFTQLPVAEKKNRSLGLLQILLFNTLAARAHNLVLLFLRGLSSKRIFGLHLQRRYKIETLMQSQKLYASSLALPAYQLFRFVPYQSAHQSNVSSGYFSTRVITGTALRRTSVLATQRIIWADKNTKCITVVQTLRFLLQPLQAGLFLFRFLPNIFTTSIFRLIPAYVHFFFSPVRFIIKSIVFSNRSRSLLFFRRILSSYNPSIRSYFLPDRALLLPLLLTRCNFSRLFLKNNLRSFVRHNSLTLTSLFYTQSIDFFGAQEFFRLLGSRTFSTALFIAKLESILPNLGARLSLFNWRGISSVFSALSHFLKILLQSFIYISRFSISDNTPSITLKRNWAFKTNSSLPVATTSAPWTAVLKQNFFCHLCLPINIWSSTYQNLRLIFVPSLSIGGFLGRFRFFFLSKFFFRSSLIIQSLMQRPFATPSFLKENFFRVATLLRISFLYSQRATLWYRLNARYTNREAALFRPQIFGAASPDPKGLQFSCLRYGLCHTNRLFFFRPLRSLFVYESVSYFHYGYRPDNRYSIKRARFHQARFTARMLFFKNTYAFFSKIRRTRRSAAFRRFLNSSYNPFTDAQRVINFQSAPRLVGSALVRAFLHWNWVLKKWPITRLCFPSLLRGRQIRRRYSPLTRQHFTPFFLLNSWFFSYDTGLHPLLIRAGGRSWRRRKLLARLQRRRLAQCYSSARYLFSQLRPRLTQFLLFRFFASQLSLLSFFRQSRWLRFYSYHKLQFPYNRVNKRFFYRKLIRIYQRLQYWPAFSLLWKQALFSTAQSYLSTRHLILSFYRGYNKLGYRHSITPVNLIGIRTKSWRCYRALLPFWVFKTLTRRFWQCLFLAITPILIRFNWQKFRVFSFSSWSYSQPSRFIPRSADFSSSYGFTGYFLPYSRHLLSKKK